MGHIEKYTDRMGIKYFYSWTRSEFPSIFSSELNRPLDILGLDLNGIFHECVEELFPTRGTTPVLQVTKSKTSMLPSIFGKMPVSLFRRICDKILEICTRFPPRRYLLLCVDGVAGMAKCHQQRQRRFRSSLSILPNGDGFDSNQLSPGTKLMDQLTKYIDWFLHREMTEHPTFWNGFQTFFSNEKVVGEGEHKLMDWIRQLAQPDDHVGILSHDSDIFMLSLVKITTPSVLLTMIREKDLYTPYQFVSLSGFRDQLLERLCWSTHDPSFDSNQALVDFVGWSCWFGNDFLPCVPSLSLKEHMSFLMDMYRDHGSRQGHLFSSRLEVLPSFYHFVKEVARHEQGWIEQRYHRQDVFFPDPLILRHGIFQMPHFCLTEFHRMRQEYYRGRLQTEDPVSVILAYVEGILWTLHYYVDGMQNWKWNYPFHYAPFLTDLHHGENTSLPSLSIPSSHNHKPPCALLQLLMILPPASKSLLPLPLQPLLHSVSSPLAAYFPETFEIDVTGKNKEWEGIVLIPFPCWTAFEKAFQELESRLSISDKMLNLEAKPFRYVFVSSPSSYSSHFGNLLECAVSSEILE